MNTQSLTLVHATENFSLDVTALSQSDIVEKVKEAGFNIGKTSLRNLINGSLAATCGFSLVRSESTEAPKAEEEVKLNTIEIVSQAPAVVEVQAPEAVVIEEVKAPEAPVVEEVKAPEAPVVESAPVSEEVKAEEPAPATPPTPEVEAPAPAPGISAFSMMAKDLSGESAAPAIAQKQAPAPEAAPAPAPLGHNGKPIKPIRRNTKNESIYQMLCAGATIKEICEKHKWTEGAVSSVVYWDPNDKGYGLDKEKVEGRGTVVYLTIDGKRINADQLVYKK